MSYRPRVDVVEVKRAAHGRWTAEILPAAGLSVDLLDGRHHPCPKCGGKDRFRLVDADGGAIRCNQCFNQKNGDGIAAVGWIRDCGFKEALSFVAEQLGITEIASHSDNVSIIERTARAKSMPLDAFLQFGPEVAKRGKTIVCRMPVWGGNGEIHSYFDIAPGAGKLDKGMFPRGQGSSGVFLPGHIPEPGETWLVVEGVKDAAALVGLGFNALGMPRNELDDRFCRLLRDVHVILVPDLDDAGVKGAQRSGGRLIGLAATVQLARLPGEVRKRGGDDVRDVLRRLGEDTVRDAINHASPWESAENIDDRERAEVIIDLDEAITSAAVMNELAKIGWDPERPPYRVFQRGGALVHITTDLAGGPITFAEDSTRIRLLPKSLLRERITQSVCLLQETEDGCKSVRPPQWLVAGIHERGEYPAAIRYLAGIIESPTLRPDGSIIQEAGHDEATGLLYQPNCEFPPVADDPRREDATRALFDLVDTVSDFPFKDDDHRCAWLSLVLTLIGRPAIVGPCPLFAIDANSRGSGKSMLADVAAMIATGNPMPRKTWPRDDDEMRKTITAVALEATPAVLIDNVAGLLGGPSLDAALTSTSWKDRILGKSETTGTLPLRAVWLATGNNIELGADTARRTLICRLESAHENPEDRTDFHHRDLLSWVRANRGRLAAAAVTILRSYFAAGRPGEDDLPPWGGFESWTPIRGAIMHAGGTDPIRTRELVRAADRSAEILGLLHAGIQEAGNEVTAAEIVKCLDSHVDEDSGDPFACLRAAVGELCGSRFDSRKLGYRLRPYLGRVRAGHRLENRPGHGGVKRWSVVPVGNAHGSPAYGGDGGHGGDDWHPVEPNTTITSHLDVSPEFSTRIVSQSRFPFDAGNGAAKNGSALLDPTVLLSNGDDP